MSVEQAVAFVLRGEGGYKAASKQFNVPRSTVQRAVQKARDEGVEPPSRARAQAREATEELELDPATCTRVEYLEYQVRRCERQALQLEAAGNLKSAREWRALGRMNRKDLDEARARDQQERDRAEAAAIRNPVELAESLLRSVPALCRIAPETSRAIWEQMGKTLGLVDADDDYAPPDERQGESE